MRASTTLEHMDMIAEIKKISLFPKIVLGSLVFMIVYGISHRRDDSAIGFSTDGMHAAQDHQAVKTFDRRAAHGMSIYREENGTQHELPTQPYYFRDRSSGRIVSSNIPDPPNDGRDYDPLTAQE